MRQLNALRVRCARVAPASRCVGALFAAVLSACGGGGGDGSSSAAGGAGVPAASPCASALAAPDALTQLNAQRARGASCGARGVFAPQPALTWSTRLESVAAAHAADMASGNFLGHVGSDGRGLAQRVDATGYAWRLLAENVAGGYVDTAAALAGWMGSPDHCANVMHPQVREVGLACVPASGRTYTSYWSLVLAEPR